MSKNTKNVLLITALVVFAALSRLFPHPDNMTPVVAICLFSVAVIKNNYLKFIVPVLVIVFSDFLIHQRTGFGFHEGTPLVYISFVLIMLMAVITLKRLTAFRTVILSVGSSGLFFLLTNFAFFYTISPVNNPAIGAYRHDLSGILASYSAGLPFFRNMLLGDLMYTGLLFGSYFLIQRALSLKPQAG